MRFRFFLLMRRWTQPAAQESCDVNGNSLMEHFCRRLVPLPFFVGLLLGLLACVFLGQQAARVDIFGDRARFFMKIAPDGQVLPTVENLCAFVRGKAKPDKILVLVGGSSIMLGVGQTNSGLWTGTLQRNLGDEFCVVNVAFRASRASSILLPLADVLEEEFPKMIVLGDSFLGEYENWTARVPGGTNYPYDYFGWNARISGRLSSNAKQDRQMFEALTSSDETRRHASFERAIQALLEGVSHSSNLWNYIGYRHFFTIYSSLVPSNLSPWTPRQVLEDDEMKNSERLPVPERFQADQSRWKSTIEGIHLNLVVMQAGRPKLSSPPEIDLLEGWIANRELRSKCLFLVTAKAPYFTRQLSQEERLRYNFSLSAWADALRGAGYAALPIGMDYRDEDFIDLFHFSEDSVPRFASEVGAEVRRMAVNMGWINDQ